MAYRLFDAELAKSGYRRPPLNPLGTTQGPAEAPRQDDEINER